MEDIRKLVIKNYDETVPIDVELIELSYKVGNKKIKQERCKFTTRKGTRLSSKDHITHIQYIGCVTEHHDYKCEDLILHIYCVPDEIEKGYIALKKELNKLIKELNSEITKTQKNIKIIEGIV